jgi:alpha-amylase
MKFAALSMLLYFSIFLIGNMHCGSTDEWKSRTVYQVLTDRFSRGDGSTDSCGNLSNYCGGNYRGLISNLDYIQNMGFDAIWISPIVDNIDGGYHGYWARNWTQLNSNFGSDDDFKEFVNECHKRGIWVMVDIVMNHVGPVGTDYSSIYPFNSPDHYHDYCEIDGGDFDGHNQWKVENCRLAGLPDLNQGNSWVREQLLSWVERIRDTYSIDGFRLDTACEVSKDFWDDLTNRAGTYIVGEVFSGNVGYVADYQNHLPGLLNYPMYFTIKNVFKDSNSMYEIKNRLSSDLPQFRDIDALGIFVDNHDNPRFLNNDGRHHRFKSALTFAMFFRGIAIMYYGSEQGFGGGADPNNREQLWTNMDQSSELYQYVKTTVEARKRNRVWENQQLEKWVDDNFYAFARGNLLVLTINTDNDQSRSIPVTWGEGTRMCNIYDGGDCVQVQGGKVNVTVSGQGPKVYEVSGNNVEKAVIV